MVDSRLKNIDEDVPFDVTIADNLAAAFNATATKIEGQAASRSSNVTTGSTDFAGYFAGLFTDNASVASSDATEVCNRLREVATAATRLREEAVKEQQRRNVARLWKEKRDNLNILDRTVEKVHDFVAGTDSSDVPVGPPADPVSIAVSEPATGTRTTYEPGTVVGSGGGVSSARPSNLRSFASGMSTLNSELTGEPAALRSHLTDFATSCTYGSLSADGVVCGLETWMSQNDNDVSWANTLADAFAAAGGEEELSSVSDSALATALETAGVTAVREDLTITAVEAVGGPPTSGYAIDPVNTATGNFVEKEVDLSFTGGCASLQLERTYSSQLEASGAFGPGWASWLDSRLVLNDDGATWIMGDGRHVVFPRLDVGWDRALGENLWLEAAPLPDGAEGLVVRDNAGGWWSFTAAGTWTGAGGQVGETVTVERGVDGEAIALVHERGRRVDVERLDGRVVAVRASDGRRVEYHYEQGRLTAASSPAGVRRYRWNDAGLIEEVIGADGVAETVNTYDARGRVIGQRTAAGRRVRLAYMRGRLTVVSDEDGTRSNSWIADARGRVVGIVDADGARQSMSYDRWGNLVIVRERDGAITVHQYDERGRRVRTKAPDGGGLRYEWDEADRLTAVTTASGACARYEYDDDGRSPSAVIDPEGGRTELAWDRGLLTRVTDPTGVSVHLGYDDHGDLTSVRNAEGGVARFARDGAGRVVRAVSPSGAATSYDYNAAGLPVSRRDPDGAVWRWEYGPGGRVTALVDPTGARTELTYSPDGQIASTRDPLGRVVRRSFDDLGNVTGLHLPDGISWSFTHDALSRLREATDPEGGVWRWEYGPTGLATAVVDPTGVRRTESLTYLPEALPAGSRRPGRGDGPAADQAAPGAGGVSISFDDGARVTTSFFDDLGRPLRQEEADGSARLVVRDRCGRVVEHVDGEGALTRLERDAAGRVTCIVDPAGESTRYEYDECGRLSRVTDPSGAVTVLSWDADSRPAGRTLPTGEVETVTRDACGRVVRRTVPGAGTWHASYDKCGRLVASSDPVLGRRRFRYDEAGQLVAAIDAMGGVTRYEYDEAGRAVRIIDPLGAVTHRRFNGRNQAVEVVDPLGRATTAGYDAAGRQTWQRDPDGHVTAWAYDGAGLQRRVSVDGRLLAEIERDIARRRVRVHEHLFDEAEPESTAQDVVEHELVFDACGRLTRRSRDGEGMFFTYDPRGLRTAMVDARDRRTRYRWDASGRLTTMEGPAGAVDLDYDAAGRLLRTRTDDIVREWVWRDGFLAEHRVSGPGDERSRTVLTRDEEGRLTALDGPGGHHELSYDDARRLISVRSTGAGGVREDRWSWDRAGRLVKATENGRTWALSYDAAGQLLEQRADDRTRLTHAWDGAGRRIRTLRSDARGNRSERTYRWNGMGYLCGVADEDADGRRDRALWVDVLGEVGRLSWSGPQGNGSADVWWDSAAAVPTLGVLGGSSVQVAPGALTGTSDLGWDDAGWRSARSTDVRDPWNTPELVAGLAGATDAATGASIGGGLLVGGLELMGARTYDPASGSFLSPDPLMAPTGASWSANPYLFAGGDPVGSSDPWGLTPVSDADLAGYVESAGVFSRLGNREGLLAGVLVVAGIALACTGVGGPAGVALMAASGGLISGGISIGVQKYQTGSVDVGVVLRDTAIGTFAGGLGGGTGWLMGLRYGAEAAAPAIASGTVEGGVTGVLNYATSPGPHTVGGYVFSGLEGAGIGALTAGAMHYATTGGAATAADGIDNVTTQTAARPLSQVSPTPDEDLVNLYRNVSGSEFDDIADTGIWRPGGGSMEGKWFATTPEHAERWGELLNRGQGLTMETSVPRSALPTGPGSVQENLDGIGPAYYIDKNQLPSFNEAMNGIRIWEPRS